jgi:hypothetical protein
LNGPPELSVISQFLATEAGTYDRVGEEPRYRTELARIGEIRSRVERAAKLDDRSLAFQEKQERWLDRCPTARRY